MPLHMMNANNQEHQQDEYYLTRKANLQKATQIRQSGYKSSIHALPEHVRAKLDQFLTWKLSPVKALAALCELYPKLELPSPKAVENYRNKYHKVTLTKRARLVAKNEIEMDLVKDILQKKLLAEIQYLTFKILPKLNRRVAMALDKEEQLGGLPLSMTNQAVMTVMRVISMLNDFLTQNNIHLFVEEKAIIQPKQYEPPDPELVKSAYEKLQNILLTKEYELLGPVEKTETPSS